MNNIRIGTKQYLTPASWQEVPAKLYARLVGIVYGPGTRAWQLHQVAGLFLPLKLKLVERIDDDSLYGIYQAFAWSLDSIPNAYPFPSIRLGLKKLLPTAANMEFSSMAEFALAESYFEAYKATGDMQYMHKLVATLCREPAKAVDSSGDKRIRVDTQKIGANARRFERRGQKFVLPVFHAYLGCRQYIFDTYYEVFPKSKSGTNAGAAAVHYDLFDLTRDAAKSSLFGNYEETQHTNVHIILYHLHRQREIEKATAKP